MAEAYFKHAKRGRFEDEDGTDRDAGADHFVKCTIPVKVDVCIFILCIHYALTLGSVD